MRTFDFNEEPMGNYETLPMRWVRHRSTGFPHYLSAGFDKTTGHSGAPSFRLDLNGGSIAYHYRNRSIEVVPASEYIVYAWIRTEKLQRARAYLSAAMMNRSGEIIPETQVYSAMVGGTPDQDQWRLIQIVLPGGVRDARFLSLSLWLTQSDITDAIRENRSDVAEEIEDIHGSAWFDDITIYRLPRVHLDTGLPGNIFTSTETVTLKTLVADPDGIGLRAKLKIQDAAGRIIHNKPLPIRPITQLDPDPLQLPDLPPGLYRADLVVMSSTGVLTYRNLVFARLSPKLSPKTGMQSKKGFGITLAAPLSPNNEAYMRLLGELDAKWLKVPVWSLTTLDIINSKPTPTASESFLTQTSNRGYDLVGWIGGDLLPKKQREDALLLTVLASDPSLWRPSLAYTWSLYAGLIQWWQIGNESDSAVVWDDRLPYVIERVKKEMSSVMEQPQLILPTNLLKATDDNAPKAESVSAYALHIPSSIPSASLAESWNTQGMTKLPLWITLETPSETAYPRLARLADLTKRLVLTRMQNVSAVFIAQPWKTDDKGNLSPKEDYLIFRTVADLLGDTTGIGMMVLDGRAQCAAFDRSGKAVLAIWDDFAPSEGRDYWLTLDRGARQIDPWGNVQMLHAVGTQYRIRIGRIPTFIDCMPTWLAKLHQSIRINPSRVEADLTRHTATIEFTNNFTEPISGTVRLLPPPNWTVAPYQMTFALTSGQSCRLDASVSFPINEPSGTKLILADFEIDAERRYRARIPVWFELGLLGIEIDSFVQRVGSDVIVRQSVTNHTNQTVSFYGFLLASQREEIQRLIANLQPGQTITKEYELPDATPLIGRYMMLGLREVNGGRIWNRFMEIP